jgi:hypothetical protein
MRTTTRNLPMLVSTATAENFQGSCSLSRVATLLPDSPIYCREQAGGEVRVEVAVATHLVHLVPLGVRHVFLHHLGCHVLHHHGVEVATKTGVGGLENVRTPNQNDVLPRASFDNSSKLCST